MISERRNHALQMRYVSNIAADRTLKPGAMPSGVRQATRTEHDKRSSADGERPG
jgi:hypothetical protein